MSMSPKSAASAGASVRQANLYRVAIVGGATLKGKEVAEILNDRNFPALDVKLLDDDESLGQLEAMGDEVTFIQSLRREQFDHVDFTFFASDPECTRSSWTTARRAGSAVVDLSYALEEDASSSVRSPWIERELQKSIPVDLQQGPVVVAHPAAIVLGLLILRARRAAEVSRVVATIFEPASEHGQKGMDELHQQTVNLLSFQQLPKSVFDAQVAFNMITRYGESSLPTLESVERRVLKHYACVAGADLPRPSVAMVQAPIFHGYAFSIYLEMTEQVASGDLTQALSGEHVTITRKAEDAPSNVNAAGQGAILLSPARGVNHGREFWLWAAADNLRIAASTAVECAETMAAARPRGKIQ